MRTYARPQFHLFHISNPKSPILPATPRIAYSQNAATSMPA